MAGTAILNGFGRTLGDSVIGLQALFAAQALGAVDMHPVLFRLPGLSPVIQQLYGVADFARVDVLPWEEATPERAFAAAAAFGRVIDMRDFAFDPAFRGVAMIAYFRARLGLVPGDVPPGLRRNIWLRGRVGGRGRGGYALVCPKTASPMRSMPDAVHDHVMAWLRRSTGGEVLSQAVLPQAGGLAELCMLVAGARCIVSADTAMVHLADAFDVPCLAFFTTHRPEWRVRDYPRCRAVDLAPAGLPAALEFVRGPEDVAACAASWFARGADLGWLDAVLDEFWRDAR